MKYPDRSPVLIIGAHRSGTTATAHALELLGLQIGQHLDSHREPYELQKVHEDYLRRVGARWYEPQPFLDAISTPEGLDECVRYLRENLDRGFGRLFGYRSNPKGWWRRARLILDAAWGWKEPRTTLFAAAWLQIFPEARLLHVIRDPGAAAASIRERELTFQAAGDAPSGRISDIAYGTELVRTYIAAGERLRQSPNYRAVEFDALQAKPAAVLGSLGRHCGLRFTEQQLSLAAATIRPSVVRR